jgi:hypothetical protein
VTPQIDQDAAVREAGIAVAIAVNGGVTPLKREPDILLIHSVDSPLDSKLVAWVSRELILLPACTQSENVWRIETELAQGRINIPSLRRDFNLDRT